jgi:NAD(P)H-dependent flavin oxidoreductase YrpB (nitropropane dioxygenase family)
MIHTRIRDLLGIVHPIVLGGMGTATTAPLVAAVSNAGGFGTLGSSAFNPDIVAEAEASSKIASRVCCGKTAKKFAPDKITNLIQKHPNLRGASR